MDINFHYAAIKAIARHAGFDSAESELVAYASQFVDDANEYKALNLDRDPEVDGIRFDGVEFDPICTAHKDLDYANAVFDRRARLVVYACFHFIPSFSGPGAAKGRQVLKDGDLSRNLVIDAVDTLKGGVQKNRARDLIRLGLALHSYADTWAHQGFSGFWDHENNDISNLKIKTARNRWESVNPISTFVSYAAPDIGHGEAGSLPDRSDVSWQCEPYKTTEKRSNSVEFLGAAKMILQLLSGYGDRARSWSTIEKKLSRCFAKPVAGARDFRKNNIWKSEFPDMTFNYDSERWFNQALGARGGAFDWIGAGLGLDPKDYIVKKGKNYFHFHACAGEQRGRVEAAIKVRGLHRGV